MVSPSLGKSLTFKNRSLLADPKIHISNYYDVFYYIK